MTKAKLTDKQELFCKEYLVDLNGAQAAIRAGYSEKTARDIACQNLAKPNIQEKIHKLKSERSNKVKLDARYVLERLKEIDELDILDIMNEELDGFKRLSEWPKAWRTSISGIDIQTMISGGEQEPIEKVIKKIKWPDKTKNLELIGRHVNVRAWEKEEQKESAQDITINFVDAVKPDAD